MHLFTKIEDGIAILRLRKGILKQVSLYHREERLYAPHSGGFIEIRTPMPTQHPTTSGAYSTAHPDVQVLDFEMGSTFETHHKRETGLEVLRLRLPR